MSEDETRPLGDLPARPGRRGRGATLAEARAVRPGGRFGRFVVLEQLGQGGMGVVVAAYDPDLDRKVAIKVLRPDGPLAAPAARAQLIREAKAMARLTHPNVVTVHEVGAVDDIVYLVMELVDGSTLATWLEQGPRSWREVVTVLSAAGRGLAAAHAAGLVHRDFKPHNVLIGRDGRVRVTDFGVVGIAAPAPGQEAARDALPDLGGGVGAAGTPAYMAPEQHDAAAVDGRADQFAFCVTLYEALYGQRPFAGADVDELRLAVAAGAPLEPPRRHAPAWLFLAIRRGLSLEPRDRFPDLAALLAVLERRPHTRRGVVLGGVVAVAIAAAAAVGWTRMSTPAGAPCDDGAGLLADSWGPRQAAAVRASFARARPADGAAVADRVVAMLDRYAAAWTAQRRAWCLADRAPDAAPTVVREHGRCLDRQRLELRATAALFGGAIDASVVTRAVAAVADLPATATCDPGRVTAATPLQPLALAIEDRLQRVGALRRAGQYRQARVLVDELAVLAGRGGAPDRAAEILVAVGETRSDDDDGGGAAAALSEALTAAARTGDDDATAHALLELAWVRAYLQGRPRDALALEPVLTAALARIGDPPLLRARALHVLATAWIELGDYPAAMAPLRQAVEVWERELDPGLPEAARPLLALGNVANYQGRSDEAIAAYRKVIAQRERVLGADHTDLAGPLGNLGGALADLGDADGARRACQRALDLLTRMGAGGSARVARYHGCLGEAAAVAGDLGTARVLLEQALTLSESDPAVGGRDYLRMDLAEVLLAAGATAPAGTLCQAVLESFAGDGLSEHPDLARAYGCLGRVRLAAGERAAAGRDLEQALSRFDRGGGAQRHRALTEFALAQVLPATDVARADALAVAAAKGLARVDPSRAAEIERWRRELRREPR
ncbi:MAG: serine/threonine protein kinase [Kofleriaceae bacterium]|nr:serine/threonine protein kinase [Kofleriaceae bacterium]